MEVKERPLPFRDGRIATLRSARPEDARAILDLMAQANRESYFMARSADEVLLTPEAVWEEADYLSRTLKDPRSLQLCAVVDGALVGAAGIQPISTRRKLAHRAGFGISVLQAFWNQGLGTKMLQVCLDSAREMGYLQVELGVYADNPRAIHVYEKLGFRAWGTTPRAFRLQDGSFRDELQMVRYLDT